MKLRMIVAGLVLLPAAACAGNEGPAATAEVASAPAVDATVDCPGLARVKYPFLRCVEDADGNVVFAGAPDVIEGSQMPPMDPFVESADYYGN